MKVESGPAPAGREPDVFETCGLGAVRFGDRFRAQVRWFAPY
ncbi:hypothetical protein QTH97_23005 [Variovorax sp. J22R24]|nr:hypothetical protein [Variovorax sp. J22R24]MDM0107834.1 hypothetical protein [Variovorax sp. J22R24]